MDLAPSCFAILCIFKYRPPGWASVVASPFPLRIIILYLYRFPAVKLWRRYYFLWKNLGEEFPTLEEPSESDARAMI